MSIGSQGQNLIFLISQPRAGSTLLQRILGGHPAIHTSSEPWLMLHPLYALRSNGYQAEYNEQLAQRALQDFLEQLPNGENEYIEGVRQMYTYLYERALINTNKQYFLDKTPRYYFIISELHQIFPQAQYITLIRNPLAVLCSLIRKREGNWFLLYRNKYDLLQAPYLLLNGIEQLKKQVTVIYYEQLVKNPGHEIWRICQKLGLDFVPAMLEYNNFDFSNWSFGDQGEINRHAQPVLQNVEKWVSDLDDPQTWQLANDYLQFLDEETVQRMGYSFKELERILKAHRPHKVRLWRKLTLSQLLSKPVKAKHKN